MKKYKAYVVYNPLTAEYMAEVDGLEYYWSPAFRKAFIFTSLIEAQDWAQSRIFQCEVHKVTVICEGKLCHK